MNKRKLLSIIPAAAAAFTAHGPAMAAGGLAKAESEASYWLYGIYALLGICSGLYLLYLFFLAKLNKGTWQDFFMGILHVALGGASITIATYAWNFFTS